MHSPNLEPKLAARSSVCRLIQPGNAEGRALVSPDVFPFSGVTFDLPTGVVRWPGHTLNGKSVKGTVLVLPKIRAFASGDWALVALSSLYRSGPSAILCGELPPFLAAGALLGKVTTYAGLPEALLKSISDGDAISIQGDRQRLRLTIRRKNGNGQDAPENIDFEVMEHAGEVKLSKEQTRFADGSHGAALKECMQLMIEYARVVGAQRLIPITSAHAAGSGFNTTGDVAIRFLQGLVAEQVRTVVPATLNPIAVDLDRWDGVLGMPAKLFDRQVQLNEAFARLGFIGTYSCKPYWTKHAAEPGENFVSGEHIVVSYSNSVIGARSNLESNIIGIISAFLGCIPLYGLYLPENRRPSIRVLVPPSLGDAVDWRCLGVAAARKTGGQIPYFHGFGARPTEQNMRDLCGAYGPPWTSAPMLHAEGGTADWESARDAALHLKEIVLTMSDIESVRQELFVATDADIDLVALGCPQASIGEIEEIAGYLDGVRVADRTRLWIWTDAETRAAAQSAGLVAIIESAGGQLIADTCGCAACPIDRSRHAIKHVVTDSTKSCGFLNRSEIVTHLGSVGECLDAALTGRWRKRSLGG